MDRQTRYQDYDVWSRLYNQTFGPHYSANQLRSLEILLLPQIPSSATLLDLCCGTGHLAKYLSDKGYHVTGLDGSESMVAYAVQNAPQARFIVDDARTFSLPPSFDAVFSTSASLNHIMSLEELQQVFCRVHAALKENGVFLFDLNHPAQMAKWWRGKIAEGEISSDYAWAILSDYDCQDDEGYFKVLLFEFPASEGNLLKFFSGLLNLKILTKIRLKLLKRLATDPQAATKTEMLYHVRGYANEQVRSSLSAAGFIDIDIRTSQGSSHLDADHSAYFICRKATL